jgi:peptide/nickel transport system substrate-binding protein
MHISQLNTYPGKPFSDKRVREAANLAIDRKALIENIWGGHAKPAQGQVVGQYVFGADPEMEDFPYDPERAKALLKEAGKEGVEVTMWTTTGRWPKDRDAADAQAEMLKAVGFKPVVKYPEFSEWLKPVFAAAEDDKNVPDMILENTSAHLFDSSNALVANIHCKGSHSLYCSKEIDSLMAQTDVELDVEKRKDLFHQIHNKLHEDAVLLTVADVYGLNFASKDLNWPQRNDVFIPIQEMSFDN